MTKEYEDKGFLLTDKTAEGLKINTKTDVKEWIKKLREQIQNEDAISKHKKKFKEQSKK